MAKEKVNYQELNVEELNRRKDNSQASLFKLRFRAATATLKNSMQIRNLRREIARLNTFINQRRSNP